MASRIKNVVETTFTSRGAAKVEKETQSIGRAQTRLGQESASAGRQFAAQATGLGGIVAAYAGAAATVFALSSAFEALARSARAAQTINALNVLAAETGASGRELSASIQEVVKGQLTLLQVTEKLNISLSAGFTTDQIEGLADVALRSSRALGRDLDDSFKRVVKGAAELNTGVLKQLGIFVRVDTAVAAYATSVGKAASELSEYERRQALVNAVIDQGRVKFSGINTTIPTTLQQIESFTVKVRDLAIQFGILIADTLAPLAGILTDSVGGAFAAVGLTISLVASKGVAVLTLGANALTASITNTGIAAEQTIRSFTGTAEASQKATAAITALDSATLKLNKRQTEQVITLQQTASSRSLSSVEIKEGTKLINANIVALEREKQSIITNNAALVERRRTTIQALQAARAVEKAARAEPAGQFGTREFARRTAAIRAATKEVEIQRAELLKLTPALREYSRSLRQNTVDIEQNRITLGTLNTSLKGFVAGFSNAAVTVTTATANFIAGFTGLATSIFSLGSRIFFAVNLITLLGTTIAGVLGRTREFDAIVSNLGSAFRSIFSSTSARNVKEVLQGISAASVEELEKVDSTLKDIDEFTFKTKFVGINIEVTKTKQDLIDEVNAVIAATAVDAERSVVDSIGTGTAIGAILGNLAAGAVRFAGPPGAIIGTVFGRQIATAAGAAIGTFWTFFRADESIPEELKNSIKQEFASAFGGVDAPIADRLVTAIAKVRGNLEDAAAIDPRARAALRFQEQLILASTKYLENIEAVSDIFAATALPIDTIVRNFQFVRAKDDANDVLKTLTTIQGRQFRFEFVTDAQRAALREVLTVKVPDSVRLGFPALDALRDLNIEARQVGRTLEDTIESLFVNNVFTLPEDIDAELSDFLTRQQNNITNLRDSLKSANLDDTTRQAKVAFDGFTGIEKPFLSFVDAVDRYQQSALRAVEVGRALSEALETGTIDIEGFTQGFGNLNNSIILSERRLATITEKLAAVNAELEKEDPKRRATLEAQRDFYQGIVANVTEQLGVARLLLGVLEKQGKELREQERVTKFLQSFQVKDFDPIKLSFDLQLAGLSDIERFSQTIKVLTADITEDALAGFEALENVTTRLNKLNLLPPEVQAVLSTVDGNVEKLAERLNKIEGITASIKAGQLEIATTKDTAKPLVDIFEAADIKAASLASRVQLAQQAIKGFVEQNVQRLPQLIDAALNNFQKLREDIDKELDKLSQKEFDIKFKARLDEIDFNNQVNLLKSRFELDRLQLQVELVAAQVSVGRLTARQGAEQENRLQQQILTERKNLIELEYRQQRDAIGRKAQEAGLEYDRNLEVIALEAQAQKERAIQEAAFIKAIIDAYISILDNQEKINQALITDLISSGQNISDVLIKTFNAGAVTLNSAIRSGLEKEPEFIPAETQTITRTPVSETGVKATLEASRTAVQDELAKTINRIEALERRRRELAEQTFNAVRDGLVREIQIIEQTRDNKLELLRIEGEIEELNALKRVQDAKGTADKLSEEAERIKQALLAIFDGLNSAIETSLIEVKNLILFGEGNLQDIFVKLLRSIGDTILEEGFIKPISERLTQSLFGSLTGIQGGRSGIEEAFKLRGSSPANPVFVSTGQGPLGGLLTPRQDEDAAGVGGFLQNIGNSIKNIFGNLFGADGAITRLISGFGNIVGSVFTGILKFITSIFGFASGGAVHRAAGGAIPQFASGGGLRDRVPALLEPGEFVLRRAAANKIGISNLQQMNATGQTPSGAPIINFTNEGTAKSVESSEPRFDGERYVIDIVTRDLQNNGPIRRSLRSGL